MIEIHSLEELPKTVAGKFPSSTLLMILITSNRKSNSFCRVLLQHKIVSYLS